MMDTIFCPSCNTLAESHPANRCLDAWVAESVMGWVWYRDEAFQHPPYVLNPPISNPSSFYLEPTKRPEQIEVAYLENVPYYSISHDYAWTVVDRVIEELSMPGPRGGSRWGNFVFYHNRFRNADYDHLSYQAVFKREKPYAAFTSFGDTFPHAVCRAALLSK